MTEVAAEHTSPEKSYRWVALPLLVFALVSLTAGLLSAHDQRSGRYFRLFFSDPVHMKAGLATAAALLACFQVLSAAWIFRKLPWRRPAWIAGAHRWSGRLAFAFTLPVAYHCIFKLGFQDPDTRVLVHSLLGCAVYGAFAAKVTIVRLHRFPAPVLPVAGGLLFALLIGIWYLSALWLYRNDGAPPAGNVQAGAAVFRDAGCGACHTMAAAEALANVGPNLDVVRPTFAVTQAKVEDGGGAMPPFKGTLTPEQIRDVAAFVAARAGS